jgi:hypothetical protein
MPVASHLSGPVPFLIAAILGGWLAFRSGQTGRRFVLSSGPMALGGVLLLCACLAAAGIIDANESGGNWYQSTFVTEQAPPTMYRCVILLVVASGLHLLGRVARAKRSKAE